MNGALQHIIEKRRAICERAGAQREQLAVLVRRLEPGFTMVDKGVAVAGYLKAHPLLVGGLVAVLAALRARSIGSLVARGVGLWRITRWVGRITRKLRS